MEEQEIKSDVTEHGPEQQVVKGNVKDDPKTGSKADSPVSKKPKQGSSKKSSAALASLRVKERTVMGGGLSRRDVGFMRVRALEKGEEVPVGAELTDEPVCDWQEETN